MSAQQKQLNIAMSSMQNGNPRQALANCRKVLKTDPKNLMALNIGGVAAFHIGDLKRGAAMLKKAIELNPTNVEAHYNHGLIEAALGNFPKAEIALDNASRLAPNNPGVFLNLANVLTDLNRFGDAESAYRKAIFLKPDYVLAIENLGSLLLKLERPSEAKEIFLSLIEKGQKNTSVLTGLGEAFRELGCFQEAISVVQQAISISPKDAEPYIQLSILYKECGELAAAEVKCREAIAIDQNQADFQFLLGNILHELGNVKEVELVFRSTLALDPNHIGCLKNFAKLLSELGRFDESKALFSRVFKKNPNDIGAFLNLNRKDITNRDDPFLKSMQKLLDNPQLSLDDRTMVHFRLAKTFDKLGEYDEAFEHYQKGNEKRPDSPERDIGHYGDLMKRTAKVFTGPLISDRKDCGDPSDAPIFIVGMPRSGTTLIEQIVAAHPDAYGKGETGNIAQLASKIGNPITGYPEAAKDLDESFFKEFGETYINLLRYGTANARHVTDKMPDNFLYLGLIRLALPNAKIIHCMRDPIATCFSCYQRNFSATSPYVGDLRELGQYYVAYQELMDHWNEVLGGWVLNVQYEDLVKNAEHETRRIIEFCDLPWNETCLSFYKQEQWVRTSDRTRQPIYTKAIAHWNNYDNYLSPLKEALGISG